MSDAAPFRLTSLAHGAGCACKIRPADLARVMREASTIFSASAFANAALDASTIVGLALPDDAAVVRLPNAANAPNAPALVLTTDFFTPIVDDAATFGEIAATNAMSDVWAMGGTPLFALALAAFPTKTVPLELLAKILAGGVTAAARAGVAIVGGHTIDDPEPKYGLAVIGTIDPEKVWRKRGVRAGDALVLTKALGTGVLTTARKRDAIDAEGLDEAIASMRTSNQRAAALARSRDVHAATDVTGYGLIGHLHEMIDGRETVASNDGRETVASNDGRETVASNAGRETVASNDGRDETDGVDAVIAAAALPLFSSAKALAKAGFVPGGSTANLAHATPRLDVAAGVDPAIVALAADAQTSGGLLFAMSDADARAYVADFGAPAAIVGHARRGSGRIRLQ